MAEAAGETGNSTSEELNAQEGVGAPTSMGAPLDDGSGQELKGAVAAEPEVPAAPEQSAVSEESEGPQNAPEFSGQPAGEVKEMGPKPDIPKDKEQETQEAVQATSILDKVL